eukprot:3752721-Rhodomonas_salina.1
MRGSAALEAASGARTRRGALVRDRAGAKQRVERGAEALHGAPVAYTQSGTKSSWSEKGAASRRAQRYAHAMFVCEGCGAGKWEKRSDAWPNVCLPLRKLTAMLKWQRSMRPLSQRPRRAQGCTLRAGRRAEGGTCCSRAGDPLREVKGRAR